MEQRTPQQNRALHKYFELLAEGLNSAGLDMRIVLKPEIDIPWTQQSVKEQLFKPIMKAAIHKDSTTELNSLEIDRVYEILTRHLAEKFGIDFIAFPSEESLQSDKK